MVYWRMKDVGTARVLSAAWKVAIYVLMIVGTVGGFLLVRHLGQPLQALAGPNLHPLGGSALVPKLHVLLDVLLALAIVIVMAKGMGILAARIGQPAVIGEILAGISLGPSVLGRLSPALLERAMPQTAAPYLGLLANVGVILYMFLVGLELDVERLKKRTHAMVAISHASIVTPFLLGSVLALFIYPRLSSSDVPFSSFALFCAVSMSVTAFPVLARILTDRGVHTSNLGTIALTCAAVDDITAWCLLAVVVAVVKSQLTDLLRSALLLLLYLAAMLIVVRPLLRRLTAAQERRGALGKGPMATILVGLLLSAVATEYVGIHGVFGAFLMGALIPAKSVVARDIKAKIEDIVVILFLPAFFAYTGLRTRLDLLVQPWHWLVCAVIILVASMGKFGGSSIAARISGLGWRDAAAVGILMNTRGLMELIVLNIGLDLKIISPTLFVMLVIMAVVTTMATTPVLDLLYARHFVPERVPAQAPEASASQAL
jgi:Kef-type K+ transport system membrane component KefB